MRYTYKSKDKTVNTRYLLSPHAELVHKIINEYDGLTWHDKGELIGNRVGLDVSANMIKSFVSRNFNDAKAKKRPFKIGTKVVIERPAELTMMKINPIISRKWTADGLAA